MKITERTISNNAKRFKSLVRRPYLAVNELSGEYRGSPLRMIIADDGSTLPYMNSVVFPNGSKISERGLVAVAQAPRLADADADLVCIGANQFLLGLYKNHPFTLVPKWLRLYLPVSGHPDEMITRLSGESGGSVRRMVRKMKENRFSYEVTHDPCWFDDFYTRMYEPYSLNRFGPLAVVDSYRNVRSRFTRGGGLVVKRDGQPVGAVIVFRRGSTLWFHRVGIMDGNEDLTREGASTALYYFTILFAHESGCDGVDFGHSRPLASDGALRYKLKWGMRVLDEDDSIGAFAIATSSTSEVARKFLEDNRFYQFTSKGIRLPDEY